jgi:hypothetical protein
MNAIDLIFLHNNSLTYRQTITQTSAIPVLSFADLNTTIRTNLLLASQASIEESNISAADIFGPPPLTLSSTGIMDDEPDEVRIAREAHHTAYEAHKAALQRAARAAAAQVVPDFSIKVHGINGIRDIATEEAWEGVKREVNDCVWMMGYLRVIIGVVEG